MSETLQWRGDGSAYSPRFQEGYHSRSGALAQASTVFLAGCGLPGRWRGRDRFTVLETGFGLGLNFLATWAAWEADPQRSEQLHFVSIEAYPVGPQDIVRNAQACMQKRADALPVNVRTFELAQTLALAWQNLHGGVQHRWFANGRVQLTLAVGDVQPMLQALDGSADAVYLDGFSPARNPAMWSPETLQQVAAHCKPGTTLASYTVAAQVRRSLQQLGFIVEKCPGLPPKRHRLQAQLG